MSLPGPIVLVVGDIATDTIIRVTQKGPDNTGADTEAVILDRAGGQGGNVARWLAAETNARPRLLATASSSELKRTSGVADGTLKQAGIDTRIVWVDAPPARVVSIVDLDGSERSFFTQRGAAGYLDETHVTPELLDGVKWCHVSGYLLTNTTGQSCFASLRSLCRRLGVPLSFDPASTSVINDLGVTSWRSLVGHVDLLLPNAEEAKALTGESDLKVAASSLLEYARRVVVKDGEKGCIVASDGSIIRFHSQPASPVDPTGAGDAFAAGVVAILAGLGTVGEATAEGLRLGSRCVSHVGALPVVSDT
jgi:sugar/nucleoside kinase (ribokinase family)